MLARSLAAQIPLSGAQTEQPGPIQEEEDAPRVVGPGTSQPQMPPLVADAHWASTDGPRGPGAAKKCNA